MPSGCLYLAKRLFLFFFPSLEASARSCGCFQGNHIPFRNLPCLTLDTVRLHGNKAPKVPVKYMVFYQRIEDVTSSSNLLFALPKKTEKGVSCRNCSQALPLVFSH